MKRKIENRAKYRVYQMEIKVCCHRFEKTRKVMPKFILKIF